MEAESTDTGARQQLDDFPEISERQCAVISTVGLSPEPVIYGLKERYRELDERGWPLSRILLFFGADRGGGGNAPVHYASQIQQTLAEGDSLTRPRLEQVDDPESLPACIDEMKRELDALDEEGFSDVFINFTGGSKPFASAVVVAGVTGDYGFNVHLDYVEVETDDRGGVLGGTESLTTFSRAEFDHFFDRAVELLGEYHFHAAVDFTEELPDAAPYRELGAVCRAFQAVDSFHYAKAGDLLGEAEPALRALGETGEGGFRDLCSRGVELLEQINSLRGLVRQLRIATEGRLKNPGSVPLENGPLLVAELINGAARSRLRGEHGESVLRCYRAVEAAVQLALMGEGLNPFGLDLDEHPESLAETFLEASGLDELPERVALHKAVTLHAVKTGGELDGELDTALTRLSEKRNLSFLEHGYIHRTGDEARECLEDYAGPLCRYYLELDEAELDAARERIELVDEAGE